MDRPSRDLFNSAHSAAVGALEEMFNVSGCWRILITHPSFCSAGGPRQSHSWAMCDIIQLKTDQIAAMAERHGHGGGYDKTLADLGGIVVGRWKMKTPAGNYKAVDSKWYQK